MEVQVIGRRRECELVVAALLSGRHLLLEGPPGTGKSTMLRAVADATGIEMDFVEGNAELTPARLIGHFDPAQVLEQGYRPDIWIDGPLARALRGGHLLYLEEINRVPEETLNLLVTVMSEQELTVPRLGRLRAEPGFRLVAAMNPYDSIGTARISGAIYDRICRLAVDYQPSDQETSITRVQAGPAAPDRLVAGAVAVVRALRDHPEVRIGPSVRGAIDLVKLAESLSVIRNVAVDRLRPRPGCRADGALGAPPAPRLGHHHRRGGGHRGLDPHHGGARNTGRSGHRRTQRRRRVTRGKRDQPQGGEPDLDDEQLDKLLDSEQSADALAEEARRTTSRRQLEYHPAFNLLSADIGELDEDAFDDLWLQDPDQALEILALMNHATDRTLAALARRLAGRLLIDLAAAGPARSGGVGRLVSQRARPDSGDIDMDASLDAIHGALVEGRRPSLEDLTTRTWSRPQTVVCLLVDRSGSMDGARLATAALAAAACTWRAPGELAVLAFGDRVLTIKDLGHEQDPESVVTSVLRLRGHGTTDIDLALKAARRQLQSSTARRRVVVLLSDGESTTGHDPVPTARSIDELAIIAPADEPDHAIRLGRETGARLRLVAGPLDVVSALNGVLNNRR